MGKKERKKRAPYKMESKLGVGYKGLANAIVYNAAIEYRYALRSKSDREKWKLAGLRNFFLSDWYKTLCSIDGATLMRKIEAQVERENKEKEEKAKKCKKDRK